MFGKWSSDYPSDCTLTWALAGDAEIYPTHITLENVSSRSSIITVTSPENIEKVDVYDMSLIVSYATHTYDD